MTEMLVQSMTSQLIVRFRDRILSGAYAPGSALRQDSLAAEFGTSKIPVREALVQLQSEGLVDIFPNRGFQVRPLASAELDEVFRLRLQIEPSAVARGATLAGAADHAAARAALEQLNEHLRPDGRAKRATREHAALLRAWSAGKSREARALMHSHIKSTRDDLQGRLRG